MKRPIWVLALILVSVFLSNCSGFAQQVAFPVVDRVSALEAGVLYGRTGSATGFSAYVEVNPIRWVGICAFVSQSRATSEAEDGLVHAWDSSSGGCVTTHLPRWKGFLVSPFAQFSHQRDHQHIDIPVGDGTTYVEMDSHTHRLWGPGASVNRAIVKDGPQWMVRIGRNFGAGPAAKNASGIYAVAGILFPLDHPVALSRSFKRMVGLR